MSKSNYLENKLLDHTLRNTTYTSPTTVYAALYTSNPDEANTGTELSGGSYTREAVTFSAAASGSITNSGTVAFQDLPAATVTHIGILDASTSGNLLYYAALIDEIITTSGSDIVFNASQITITES